MTTSALDKVGRQQAPRTVSEALAVITPQLQRAMPKGMDGDRLTRLAMTVVRTDAEACRKRGKPNEGLANADPNSFAGALLTAAALGLEVGTGEAHLVAHGKEVSLIPDFKGLAKLYYQSPLAKHLESNFVCENDLFEYEEGSNPHLRFRKARGERGAVTDYYALATLTTGAVAFVVLTPDEVKALRRGKVGPSGNIPDPQRWMERKTVLKQLFKMLPKSTQLQQAMNADDRDGDQSWRTLDVAPVAIAPTPDGVDTATGVIEPGVQVQDPDEPSWPATPPIPA